MASKLAAAKMATWSGVNTVIAGAGRSNVLLDVLAGVPRVGTSFPARTSRLSARKVWIAFALPSVGQIIVDDGARTAIAERGRSLLAAGVTDVTGDFDVDDAVEIVDRSGVVFAKGLVSWPSVVVGENAGKTNLGDAERTRRRRGPPGSNGVAPGTVIRPWARR